MIQVWHEEISGMVKGPAIFEGQDEWVRLEDHLAALEDLRKRQQYTYIGKDGKSVLARVLEDRLIEAEAALKPFSELPDNAHGKSRYFLELLVCPEGDTPKEGVKHYGEAIRRAKAVFEGDHQ